MSIEEEAVQRGIELLEKYEINWYQKINTDKLSLSPWNACVMGQMAGLGINGHNLKELAKWLSRARIDGHLISHYGLSAVNGNGEELVKEWTKQINLRKHADAIS